MDEEDFHAQFYKNAKRLHGVPYLSRYGQMEETLEMERFIRAVAAEGLEICLLGIYYDSKADLCHIETIEWLAAGCPEAERLFQVASDHISQFHLFGVIGHRCSI